MNGAGARRIEAVIRRAGDTGRPALSAFFTAGYPDRAAFGPLLDKVAREVDVVEIGVPFSDPIADGLTIQRASRAALEAGVALPWILDSLSSYAGPAPLVLMSYLNPLLAFGADRLVREAAAAGISGLIVPDLPYEESLPLRQAADAAGVALIQLVTPQTASPRLERLCRASQGFVYAVTVSGTTGGTAPCSTATLDYLDRVRAASALPVLAGFGIRTARELRRVAAHADGAVVGSALIEELERGADPIPFLRSLRAS